MDVGWKEMNLFGEVTFFSPYPQKASESHTKDQIQLSLKYVNSYLKSVDPLINEKGELVPTDTEKAEVLDMFFTSFFTGS